MTPTNITDITNWIQSLNDGLLGHSFAAPSFVRPYHLVTAALALRATKSNLLTLPEHVATYADRMGLWSAIGRHNPSFASATRDPLARFLPIEPLKSRDAVHECANRLSEIAIHANMSEASHSSLDVAIAEILDNCFAHGGVTDELTGIACAQFWRNGNLAQIAIGDSGLGIRATLDAAETPDVRLEGKSANACAFATELGVSSKLNKGHAGYGLALARQLMRQNGGTLVVYSGSEWCIGAGEAFNMGDQSTHWQGSLVVLEFNTAGRLSTQEIYGAWPPVKGYENDDFDF